MREGFCNPFPMFMSTLNKGNEHEGQGYKPRPASDLMSLKLRAQNPEILDPFGAKDDGIG